MSILTGGVSVSTDGDLQCLLSTASAVEAAPSLRSSGVQGYSIRCSANTMSYLRPIPDAPPRPCHPETVPAARLEVSEKDCAGTAVRDLPFYLGTPFLGN